MDKLQLKSVMLSVAIASALAACGGGGGGGTAAGPSGVVVNSYISGATVTLDTGNDGCATASAYPSVPTNASGAYAFPAGTPTTYGVCATGGTNTATNQPFTGVLTSPPSATVTTPLTTLVVAQMKATGATKDAAEAAVAGKLGLAATTGILTATDPVATITANPKLEPINAAVQVLMQKASESVASAASIKQSGTVSKTQVDDAKRDIYRSCAKSLEAALRASAAADFTVAVPVALVQTAIASTVTDIKTSTPSSLTTALGGSNANITALAPTNVAAIAATGVANIAQTISTASVAAGVAAVETAAGSAQSNLTIANTIATLSNLLTTTANAVSAGLTTIASNLFTTANLTTTPTNISTANILAQLNTQSGVLGVSNAVITAATSAVNAAPAPTAPAAYLQIASNQVTFNGTPFTLAAFKSPGITVTAPAAGSLDTVAFTFSAVGSPLPSTATPVSLGLQLCDASNCATGRVLQIVIDRVDMSLSGGAITATVPAGAKLTAYGKTTAGTTATLTLTNVGANVITSANNVVSFNAGTALDRVIAAAGTANTTFSNIRNAKGTFFTTLALGGVPLYDGTALLPGASVAVTGTTAVASGQGATGKITVN